MGAGIFDDAVVTYFPAPNSATGEDVVEISVHGGEFIQQELLRVLANQDSVRLAEPGEFTLRSFLNEKIDLSRAEAVAETINAQSAAAHQLAQDHLHGGIRRYLDQIKHDLLLIISFVEAELDFSDQEISRVKPETHLDQIQSIKRRAETLLSTYFYGQRLMDGFRVVLIGPTNAGKSSIFNVLCGFDRAIVTEYPGTTRDTIEGELSIAGHRVILIDTAGIRAVNDPIENIGIDRSLLELDRADIILSIHAPDAQADMPLFPGKTPVISIFNKSDLISGQATAKTTADVIISCKTGSGIDLLRQKLAEKILLSRTMADGGLIIASQRQADTLQRFSDACLAAETGIFSKIEPEYFASDLRNALSILGEITGETTPDDILNEIFSTFCIGK